MRESFAMGIRVVDPDNHDFWRVGRWRRGRDYRNWHPWSSVFYWRVWREGRLSARSLWRSWWGEFGWIAKLRKAARQ